MYRHTHVSANDGSPAMRVYESYGQIVLMNEDGFIWVDPSKDWISLD